MAELISIVIIAAVAGALYRSLRRASRRTRADLESARRRHAEAMQALAAAGEGRRLAAEVDAWAVVEGEQGGVMITVTAGADLKRTTFIRYATRISARPVVGRRLRAPADGVELDYSKPGPGMAELVSAGLPEELVRELLQVTTGLRLDAEGLTLLARSGGDVTHHYSYGLHLLCTPEGLERLWALGVALAEHLAEPL